MQILYSISCRAIVALQGIVGNMLQFYRDCSSTGNSRKCRHCVAFPLEVLSLYREQLKTHTLCSILCRATLQGIVGDVDAVQHLLQSYCSSTGNSRKYIHCVASPVELLQLQREYQEICRLYSISCGVIVALQGILGNVHVVQHLLWNCCSLTGNKRKNTHSVASPVKLLQFYKEQQETCTLCSISNFDQNLS